MTRLVTHGKTERERLAEAERVLSDRVNGMPISAMMEKYDCSKGTIYNRIDQAIAARIAPSVDAYRAQQNAALDELMAGWNAQLAMSGEFLRLAVKTVDGIEVVDPTMLDRAVRLKSEALLGMLRVGERRARLNGLDLATKVDVTVTVQDETDRAISDLNAKLAARAYAPA